MSKYDTIGIGYNTTRQADPYLLERILYFLSPTKNGSYLDIGCGTGNYTIALAERGYNFSGIDPSETMLHVAKSRSEKVVWLSGSAENIPAADDSFDGAIAMLTIHHWENPEIGFKEIYRVLKPGGRLVIFTSTPEQMSHYWLNAYFPEAMQKAIAKMPSFLRIKEAFNAANLSLISFENYEVRDDLKDLFLQSGKNRPEIYFDENVQRGISTFASLATKTEMDQGLKKLRHDIDNNLFESIKTKYNTGLGDYLFVAGAKPKVK